MKIAILGTRGIPNRYGGFEQFAENLSRHLVLLGHDVIVYNPSYHPYKENSINGVNIVRISCPEKLLKGAAHFLYDYYSLKDTVKKNADIALICGYGTSAFALSIVKKGKTKVITNMDGFEWKRSKYNFFTKMMLKWFEKLAVKHSHQIVADHPVIQNYYQEKYHVSPALISYGANIPLSFNENTPSKYKLTTGNYFLIVARDEPENQLEFIISAWKDSGVSSQLCVVTNFPRLSKKYFHQKNLVFINGLYDYSELSSLRHFSLACIHGHTVGGTNPSLLEAMAAQSLIIAHDNPFHRDILDENALYFDSKKSLSETLNVFSNRSDKKENAILNNLNKIEKYYHWEIIAEKYLAIFKLTTY